MLFTRLLHKYCTSCQALRYSIKLIYACHAAEAELGVRVRVGVGVGVELGVGVWAELGVGVRVGVGAELGIRLLASCCCCWLAAAAGKLVLLASCGTCCSSALVLCIPNTSSVHTQQCHGFETSTITGSLFAV